MKDSVLSALVFSLSWAVYLTFSKAVLSAGADAFAFGIQATFIAAFLLGAYGLIGGKIRHPGAKVAKRVVIVALLYDLSLFTGFYGLGLSTLINYGFLIKTTVVFTVLLSAAFLGERISLRKSGLVLVLLAGAYLLSTSGERIVPMEGDLWILFTALLLSVANVLSKPVVGSLDAFNFAFLRIFAGSLMFVPMSAFLNPGPLHVVSPLLTLCAGLFLALTAFLLYRTMRMTSVSYMSMFSTLTPVFVSIFAFLAFRETMNTIQFFGGALVLLAVFLLSEKE